MRELKRITDTMIFYKESEKDSILHLIGNLISKVPSGGNYQLTVGAVSEVYDNIKDCEIKIDYFENEE
ncbi:hypothetical protein [Clostridium botulinum]|uniref:hypothetical protein n=1 Tax=Clostridium botulinum TaxID=1491 RepID=UPI001C9AA89B|nr:hypothetical protein [Clostridium botulinum]MBY6838661.1 hypothetical protein [Clostridium botulinum]